MRVPRMTEMEGGLAGTAAPGQGFESGLTDWGRDDGLHVGCVPSGHFPAELEAHGLGR